ncbi:hypothetical protein [Photorhabdus sp. CRCIA-P01]|uniref:hypothetical protein n=1 Tax=Photorhabdus sp. CRCIA-P01 TaxID=2019570 RepID=UPI000E5A0128|nr:hypothetical protein [Photorhabdus sp. CRCIA-P01]
MTILTIKGRKGGGGKQRTPIESPDSIQSISKAKMLLALGEGEFAGGLDGINIYLDDSVTLIVPQALSSLLKQTSG